MSAQRVIYLKERLLAGALALLIVLVVVVACAKSSASTPTRNHVTDVQPLFVQVTFTRETSYDQAVALLQQAGLSAYPWGCDDPSNLTPPTTAAQQASFNAGHTLLVSYPTQDALNKLAASDRVTSIDSVALTMCSG